MSEGEEENIIDLIDENSTDQSNGVKVIVPVNSYDANSFFKKIKEQLCYFESVYFDVNCNGNSIDNNFKITRYVDFQMSELNSDGLLHLCLDNVYYPLDFKKLGINSISCPVGLRFGLSDGIFPTPSREAIRYSTDAKAIILKKIKTVASALVEMYNKSVEDTDDFDKIISHYSNNRRCLDIGHKHDVDISDIIQYSSIKVKNPHLKGISFLNLKKLVENREEIFSEYIVKYQLRHHKLRENKRVEFPSFNNIVEDAVTYKFSDKLGGNKKEYIKETSINRYAYFIKKRRTRKLFPDKVATTTWADKESVSYHTLLELNKHPKSKWRAIIKEFQVIQTSLEKNIVDLDALVIPKAWLDNRKAARVSVRIKKNGHQKLEGEMSCKRAEDLERYVDGKSCKFTPFSLDLKKLQQTNMFYIYTSHDEAPKLDKLYKLSSRQQRTLITFSERELKRVNELDVHNLISFDKFIEGKTAVFKRLVTSYLISRLISGNGSVFTNTKEVEKISTTLSAKLDTLNVYARTNYVKEGSGELYAAMIDVATKYSLFDYSVYNEYLEVKEMLDKFPFMETLYSKISNSYDTTNMAIRDNIIVDLLKYNKYKVNLCHYKKKVTEESNNI